ncbi:MAG: acyl carrier protein [Kiritimatiellae bacterium]|nr:acyl carrier protein [Kiritimatiellia bacterium]
MTTGDNALPQAFFELAADVFGVGAETLSSDTAFGSIEVWDSVNHLRLVMETEAKFGKPIPLEAVPGLRTLADFGPYVE